MTASKLLNKLQDEFPSYCINEQYSEIRFSNWSSNDENEKGN